MAIAGPLQLVTPNYAIRKVGRNWRIYFMMERLQIRGEYFSVPLRDSNNNLVLAETHNAARIIAIEQQRTVDKQFNRRTEVKKTMRMEQTHYIVHFKDGYKMDIKAFTPEAAMILAQGKRIQLSLDYYVTKVEWIPN